jgi:hypothetical protein
MDTPQFCPIMSGAVTDYSYTEIGPKPRSGGWTEAGGRRRLFSANVRRRTLRP